MAHLKSLSKVLESGEKFSQASLGRINTEQFAGRQLKAFWMNWFVLLARANLWRRQCFPTGKCLLPPRREALSTLAAVMRPRCQAGPPASGRFPGRRDLRRGDADTPVHEA